LDTSILLLLVEDEALIRMNLQAELEEAGFELVAATNGEQAMTELETDAARFRGLLTDIKLGQGPNGWELARHARESVPHIPVVYMSGDSAHEWDAQGVPNSIMVAKPFVGAQIITAISTLLNQTGAS
jgi:CheY-like chemotaxis protein